MDDKADSTIAPTAIGTALQANPDAVGIVGVDAVSGVGAATAVREAGLSGKVTIVCKGQGCGDAGTNQERRIAASFAQNSYVEGYIATKWATRLCERELQSRGRLSRRRDQLIPPNVDSGSIIIHTGQCRTV